jgi:hypothetical protein
VISHGPADLASESLSLVETYRARGISGTARGRAEIASFFDGLDLVKPGIEVLHRWRPDDTVPAGLTDAEVSAYGGIGRKG